MTLEISEQTAAEWIAKFDAAGLHPEDNAIESLCAADSAFSVWISQSIDNRVAFLRLYAAWRRADRLAVLTGEAYQSEKRMKRRWLATGAAMAASLLIFAIPSGEHNFNPAVPQILETDVGGQVKVPLADGTQLDVNTNTRLATNISDNERTVSLEKGEVFFDVAHDPDRPFTINVGNKRIVVLGTKFSVRNDEQGFEIIVLEGKVKVESLDQSSTAQTVILEKGAIARTNGEGTMITSRPDAQIASELGWREGMLHFDDVTLKEAVAEFNRYNVVQMEIVDPDTAAIRVGGSFQAKNIEGFGRILTTGFGLEVENSAEKLKIK